MESSITLSIIIPTKNRYVYLYHCLLSILKHYNNNEVEIVLHDNSTDEMPDNVQELINKYSIIKHVKIDYWISGWENFERSMSFARGEYVTMIGDDDSLSSYVMDAVKYMKINDIEALNAPYAHYAWPDIESRVFKKGLSGQLSITQFNCEINELDGAQQLQKLYKSGGTRLFELPRIYYGIVKRELLEKVKNASGYYIPGPSPDMASATSLALFVNQLYIVNYPLFIAGNSSKSTAGLGSKGAHVGKIEDILFLPKNCAENWSELVPRFWSGPTIWAESALKALEGCKSHDINKFNYSRLYANCLVFNPHWSAETNNTIIKYAQGRKLNVTMVYFNVYMNCASIWLERLKMLLKNMIKIAKGKINKGKVGIVGAENVYEAAERLNEILGKSNNPFQTSGQ